MSGNIFDHSASMSDGSKAKNSPPQNIKKKEPHSIDPEIAKMINRMQEMREDLDYRFDSVREAAKKNGVDIEKYFNSKYMPTKNEIDEVEMQKKVLSEKIAKAIPQESCIKKNPKSHESLTKERRGKFRGERHNWIPMS